MIYFKYSAFKINATFYATQNVITASENTVKQTKFLIQKFINALVGIVPFVDKVYDNNVVFLRIPPLLPNWFAIVMNKLLMASKGFPPARNIAPAKIPAKRLRYTCLVMRASMIAIIAGTNAQKVPTK